jgi:hypothetical protein
LDSSQRLFGHARVLDKRSAGSKIAKIPGPAPIKR